MVKNLLLPSLLLATSLAHAQPDGEKPAVDDDGFKNPLQELKFRPGLDQRVFERSTLEALEVYDPFEPINREIYHFNYRFDEWVLLPTVRGYRWITPDFVEDRVTNFFNNIRDFSGLMNSLLQLKVKRSMDTTARILLNTTIGVLGAWDPATKMGIPQQREDFGQTLGYWGVPAGPYLMLPFFGPSSLRDGTGLLVDFETEGSVDFLEFASISMDTLPMTALWAIDLRKTTDFRYGQLNSPFEYEKIRYVVTEARKLQIAE
ncbi:VacJ family lipoprotein [Pseudomonas sp.]|uniref:MlaA family lipoprotein n=1 Tax=Pseudomonas sp. TaxID=306 RepID=UPI00257C1599|nr:VacJ family lipoprotein [Pseudomonas sp.]